MGLRTIEIPLFRVHLGGNTFHSGEQSESQVCLLDFKNIILGEMACLWRQMDTNLEIGFTVFLPSQQTFSFGVLT